MVTSANSNAVFTLHENGNIAVRMRGLPLKATWESAGMVWYGMVWYLAYQLPDDVKSSHLNRFSNPFCRKLCIFADTTPTGQLEALRAVKNAKVQNIVVNPVDENHVAGLTNDGRLMLYKVCYGYCWQL